MSDTMKRNLGGTPAKAPADLKKAVEELWKEYNDIALSIRDKKDQLAKPENALDLPQIKSTISTLYLRAASICLSFLDLAREDKGVESRLIELGGKSNFLEILQKRTDLYFQNAKKYGSSIKSGTPTTTLDDIKGQDDVKDVVRSFVYLLR